MSNRTARRKQAISHKTISVSDVDVVRPTGLVSVVVNVAPSEGYRLPLSPSHYAVVTTANLTIFERDVALHWGGKKILAKSHCGVVAVSILPPETPEYEIAESRIKVAGAE
jgi:hypothetical protein